MNLCEFVSMDYDGNGVVDSRDEIWLLEQEQREEEERRRLEEEEEEEEYKRKREIGYKKNRGEYQYSPYSGFEDSIEDSDFCERDSWDEIDASLDELDRIAGDWGETW